VRHSRFFLEGACFTLLFDVIRDPLRDGIETNFLAVQEGLQCFARLPTDKLLMISTTAVTRILNLTRELVAEARNEAVPNEAVPNHWLSPTPTSYDKPKTAHQPLPNSEHSDSTMTFTPLLNYLAVQDNISERSSVSSLQGSEFFSNDLFDMSYYLWTDDPGNLGFG
jgi:hypothetical protein